MSLEHYVPRSYLRQFAPEGEGLISRYSLVETHGGGDYYPPSDRYPISKAGAAEDLADGWFENDETSKVEKEMAEAIRKIISGRNLVEDEIGRISQFLAFQNSRSPDSILHYEAREQLPFPVSGLGIDELPNHFDEAWKNALHHNANDGHETLQHMGWMVIKNRTETPFIASDLPVVHHFHQDFDDISSVDMDMHGRQIFCPLDQEHLLLLLDPERYEVEGQWPSTEINETTIEDTNVIHKFNLLQGINAFQELFGPVGYGDYLEDIIQHLCAYFPHEDYIRGNRGDLEKIRKAQDYATGITSAEEKQRYEEEYQSITISRGRKTRATWIFNHNLEIISTLLRETPKSKYWDKVQEECLSPSEDMDTRYGDNQSQY